MLQKLCREIDEKGGEDALFERIASGEKIKAIAESFCVGRTMIYRWIDLDKERRTVLLNEANKLAAEQHVDESGEILDKLEGTSPTSAEVQLASLRSGHRRWLAGVKDPERFGERRGAEEVREIGQLLVEALKLTGQRRAPVTIPAHVETEDGKLLPAEIITE